jgi:PiT family inorganic phosphate transporter
LILAAVSGTRERTVGRVGMELVVFIIFVALVFDFINGFHDAANSIATVVSTRVLSPFQAVAWAAFFNLSRLWLGVQCATTVGTGIIDPAIVDPYVIFGALMGAIIWNLITWFLRTAE